MKVHWFNHWFKYKVPINKHLEQIKQRLYTSRCYSNLWLWLDDEHDVGQWYKWNEEQNYMVFHNKEHYMMFLLKL